MRRLLIGRICGLYGVKGWVKIHSYTDPADNILNYTPWEMEKSGQRIACTVVTGRVQGKGVVVQLGGIADRESAERLLGAEIWVERARLPPPAENEYYWADLEGMSVVTTTGAPLGRIDHLFATGANDVIVVAGERERLIPYIRGQVVVAIDVEQRTLVVDWDPEF